jgi:hypothetical protein
MTRDACHCPLTMDNGPVIVDMEPRDRRTVNRRKDDRDKPLTSSSTIDVKEAEAGLKGNRRGGGNAAKYCRKLGIAALLAYMIGGPIMFLDSRGYISIPFIKFLRIKLHMKLADPKTVDAIEQKTGMKIISLEQYGGLTKELEDTKAKIAEKEKELAALAAKKTEIKEEGQFKDLNEAYAQFCAECKWRKRVSCEARKNYLISNYGSSELTALANMVKDEPQCKKSVERKEEPQFCSDCKWAKGITCEARKAYLINKYKNSEESALATMLNEPKCQKSMERRLRG